jgi:hypothetical protein
MGEMGRREEVIRRKKEKGGGRILFAFCLLPFAF